MEDQIIPHSHPQVTDSRQNVLYYLSFLVWPFGVMLAALRHRDRKWSMNIFWLFCIFLGMTFVIASEGPDYARYASTLRSFHDEGVTWSELINSIYTPGSNFVDVVQPVLTWFISLFTDNPSVLFAGFALIFGFFYSRNLWYLLWKIDDKISLVTFVFVLTFALINPIWNINGFRMWTASQVFIYGLLPYLTEGDRKKLWWSVSSVLFHFSFIFPIAMLGLYILFKNRINIYFIFFLITAFIPALDLKGIRDALGFMPEFLQPRVTIYANPLYAERIAESQQSLNWYVPLSGEILTWIIYAFSIVIFKDRKQLEGPFLAIFCFGMWLYGWANIASLVPVGERFVTLSNIVMFFLIILYLQQNSHRKVFRMFRNISIPGLLLFIIVSLRMGFDYISLTTIFGNPILAFLVEDNIPLINYVKDLFQIT